jgi:hypothetical protein
MDGGHVHLSGAERRSVAIGQVPGARDRREQAARVPVRISAPKPDHIVTPSCGDPFLKERRSLCIIMNKRKWRNWQTHQT